VTRSRVGNEFFEGSSPGTKGAKERGREMQPVARGWGEGERERKKERERERERETAVICPSPASLQASLVVSSHLRTSFVSAASPSVFHAAFCPRVSPLNSGSVASSPWLSNGH